MLWLILIAISLILILGGVVYAVRKIHKFAFVRRIAEKHKLLSWIICIAPLAVLFLLTGTVNFFVILMHLLVFWIIADITGGIIRKKTKREIKCYFEGAAAIMLTAVYLVFGWYNAHNVSRTLYTVHTDKAIPEGSMRIVGFADSHLGITLDGERFAKEMKRIQNENPDIVVIAGDFVDDSSNRNDMVSACKALGELKTKYGVYFILGNHDDGYFKGGRDFDIDDLRNELIKNKVVILEDEIAEVNNNVVIVGRRDKRDAKRADIKEITKNIDKSKFVIILDHQPNDYENEADAGVDFVFSGHTHGGHIWPTGYIGLITGANDLVYGTKVIDETEFIVTSGISGWAIPFKTGTFSEYVVIDVTN